MGMVMGLYDYLRVSWRKLKLKIKILEDDGKFECKMENFLEWELNLDKKEINFRGQLR